MYYNDNYTHIYEGEEEVYNFVPVGKPLTFFIVILSGMLLFGGPLLICNFDFAASISIIAVYTVSSLVIIFHIHRHGDVFAPIPLFFLMILFQFVLCPVTHLITGEYGIEHVRDVNIMIFRTCAFQLLGMLMLLLGYSLKIGDKVSKIFPKGPENLDYSKVQIVSFILLVISFIAAFYFMAMIGSRSRSVSLATATYLGRGLGLILLVMRFSIVVVLLLAVSRYRAKTHGHVFGGISIIFMMLFAMIINVLTLSRNQAAWIILFILIIRNNMWKRFSATLIFLALIGSIFFFIAFGYLIDVTLPETISGFIDVEAGKSFDVYFNERLVGYILGEFGRFEDAMTVIEKVPNITRGYTYGTTYISVIPIPRILWPGKPSFSTPYMNALYGQGFAENLGSVTYSRATPPLGEAYLSFGWIGVVVVFFLLGILYKAMETYRLSSQQGAMRSAFVAINLILVLHLSLFPLYQATTYYFSLLIPLMLFGHMCRANKG